jgi:hypothetical protein
MQNALPQERRWRNRCMPPLPILTSANMTVLYRHALKPLAPEDGDHLQMALNLNGEDVYVLRKRSSGNLFQTQPTQPASDVTRHTSGARGSVAAAIPTAGCGAPRKQACNSYMASNVYTLK